MVKIRNYLGLQITVLAAAALLGCPWVMFAQHGGGGGHIGGPAAGGTGLSGGNRATGIENKDDLRDFHQIMAVQATPEQRIAFVAMLKSTMVASDEVQGFLEQLNQKNNAPEIALRDKNLGDAIETARILNKKFLEGFSEAQKSGLKEMIKRVGKADAELAQEAKALDQAFEIKASSSQMAGAAQGLGRALTTFQHEQTGLGEEMSIDSSNASLDTAYSLTPVKNSVSFGGESVVISTSGVVSKGPAEGGGQNTFSVKLTSDLTDLQHSFTDLLRSQLDQSDRCGERIEVATAALTPAQPASLVVAQLHYERWSCNPVFGRDSISEIVEGNATVELKLTPVVGSDGALQLTSEMERTNAEGMLAESLRSGSLGARLRDKISDCVLSALKGGDFNAALPESARKLANLSQARFEGTGAGRLMAVFEEKMHVSDEKLVAFTGDLKARSASDAPSPVQPELTAR